MNSKILAVLVVLLLPAIGCIEEGSGVHATRELPLDNFAAIDVSGELNVTFHTCDCSEAYATVSGDDNLIHYVEFELDDGQLEVDSDGWIEPVLPLRVTLYSPGVHNVEVSGDGNIEVHDIDGSRFEGTVSGDGRLAVSGNVDHAVFDVSGDGEIEAYSLRSQDADAEISGCGHIEVCVEHALEADVSGHGLLEYACEPNRVDEDTSGDGRIQAR